MDHRKRQKLGHAFIETTLYLHITIKYYLFIIVCLPSEVTSKSSIKFFSLWIIMLYGLCNNPRVGVKLSPLGNMRYQRWWPRWPPIIYKTAILPYNFTG
jgi:hypothetical protein